MPAKPNDEMRKQILQYFYDRNASATSKYGKKGSDAKISDVKRELKNKVGLTQKSGRIESHLSNRQKMVKNLRCRKNGDRKRRNDSVEGCLV